MMSRLLLPVVLVGLMASLALRADDPSKTFNGLSLAVLEKDHLTLEPILVTLRPGFLNAPPLELPAGPGKMGETTLRFEIQPAVKPRTGAKPLPIEAGKANVQMRVYDLLEWYQFPAEGAWTVQAVLEGKGTRVTSEPVKVTIRRPAKTDAEWGPVDRIHHIPWSNYITDAFCGDCFDVVKRWPDSRMAKYSHYWNGLHHQNKKEYDKAVASFRIVTAKHGNWVLADHANIGIIECLRAQKQTAEADKLRDSVRLNFSGRSAARTSPLSAAERWLER